MKKMKLWIKIVLDAFIIILLFVCVTFGYTFYQLSKIKTTTISKTDESLGIKAEVPLKEQLPLKEELPLIEKVPLKQQVPSIDKVPLNKQDNSKTINIAFFGVDRRYVNEASRSDAIMIISIDAVHKKIKMSSIMRDTYVEINNHGKTKINHAYAYGGAQLAIRTLNENFNLDIRNYVTVDFFKLEKIIDIIDGVTINVENNEISLINSYMAEVAAIEKKPMIKIINAGPQTLNGLQTVAYSRIRYTAGDDFRRTERQRTILSAMLTKIQSLGITQFPSVVSKILPYTETSMSSMDIIKLGSKVITSNITTLDQERFPVDGYWSGKMMNGVWYLVANMKGTVDQIHKYIYYDIKPISR